MATSSSSKEDSFSPTISRLPFSTGPALSVWLVRDRKKALYWMEEDGATAEAALTDGWTRTDMWFSVGRVKSVVARVVLYEKWPINNEVSGRDC